MEEKIDLRQELKDNVLARLRRIEGQARGIQKMVEEGRDCRDVVLQLAAVKSAVVQTAMTILSHEMASCIAREMAKGSEADEALKEFMEVFKKFS